MTRFKYISKISPNNLQFSLDIYDSILVTIPESSLITEAQLDWLKFNIELLRILIKHLLCTSMLYQRPSNEIEKNIILRIADVLLAKGEHKNSITFLDSVYNIYQIQEIKNKLVEVHLFSGNPDTALSIINEIFSSIKP